MAMKLLNQCKTRLLDAELTYLNTLVLCLFVNPVTPDETDDDSDYTEPTDSGYEPHVGMSFAASTLNLSFHAQTVGPVVTFTFDHNAGDFTIYGYMVKDPADSKVVWAESNGSPVTISAEGQTYSVRPKKEQTTYGIS